MAAISTRHPFDRLRIGGAWSMEQKAISDCETGNPPEGWESEGQFRI